MRVRIMLAAAVAVGGIILVGVQAAKAASVSRDAISTADVPAGVVVPEPSEEALRYHRSGNALYGVGAAWALAVPALFFFSGGSAKLRAWLGRVTGERWLVVVTSFSVLYTLYAWLADLPLRYYAGFVRPHAYGLSTMTLGRWIDNSVKGLVVSCTLAALVTWIPYLLLRKSPRRWWLWGGLAAFPLFALLLVVAPVWIDPLFNDFGPMKDQALERRILDLADRAGIEGSRVFEVEKSVDTKTVNAYVTGFMGTKRIVLWDTIVAKLDEEELLFVMGHEMGHYVLGHVGRYLILGPLGIMAGLLFIHLFQKRIFRSTPLADVASLPLALLVITAGGLLASPAILAHSRALERDADRFGLELVQNNHAAAGAFVKLQHENLGVPDPTPFYRVFRASHPSLGERIRFCNDYRPWERGEPLVHGDRFR